MANNKATQLPPSAVFTTQSVSADKHSDVTNIFTKDNIGYQIVWTGTLNGNFYVQISADYNPNSPSAANWSTLTLSPQPNANGSPGTAYIDINQISAPFIRVFFDYTSGTGNLTITIVGKGV